MKKILFLGGTYGQIYLIQTAKKLGYYVITCDNKPNNPGHKFADEYYEVSVLNKEEVLKLAKKLTIDGIVGTAPDQAANTVAYVAEKMNLPGQHPILSVEILTNKDLFRKFLQDNGFNCPNAKGYINIEEAIKDSSNFNFPVMVKPVDSDSSRGITKVEKKEELESKIKYALSFSIQKRFIIEEYIDLPQIEGDLFSINGKLKFRCLANQYFYKNTILAICYPYNINHFLKIKIDKEIQRLFDLLNMNTGAYNLELRYSKNDIYIMEITPRNGGNSIPQSINYATGINLAEYTMKAAVGDYINDLKMVETNGYYAYYNIHSRKNGILKDIFIDNELKNKILELNILKNIKDEVEEFYNGTQAIGNVIIKFSSQKEMHYTIQNMDKYIKVIIE